MSHMSNVPPDDRPLPTGRVKPPVLSAEERSRLARVLNTQVLPNNGQFKVSVDNLADGSDEEL